MKKILLGLMAAGLVPMFWTGCVHTINGQMSPGIPLQKDTIENRYSNVSVDKAFNAAKQVLSFDGTINREDTINHTLEARVQTRTVYVKVDQPMQNVTRVQTQARTKNGAGDIDLASQLQTEIALRIAR